MRNAAAFALLVLVATPAFAVEAPPATTTDAAKADVKTDAAKLDFPARSVDVQTPISGYELTPVLRARAERHAQAKAREYVVDLVWGIAVLLLVLRFGWAARIQRLAERVAKRRFSQACVFAPLFLLLVAVLELPTAIWSQHTERSFGLSVQGWGSFAQDWLVGHVLLTLLGTFLVWLLYAVMKKSPRRFWLWAWLAMLPILVFVMFIEPFVVEPLFFRFEPLAAQHPALVEQLHAIAERRGEDISRARMFEMNASSKLRELNAYVTGFGASKRVVVWDTTLAAMTDREIDFVFGHELGHYALGHVVQGLFIGAAGLLLALFVGAKVAERIVARRGQRYGIARLDDFASLPLLLLIVSLLGTIATPVGAAYSRHVEHAADVFGLAAIDGVVPDARQAAAHAFQRLGEIDLAEPDPSRLTVLWLYDHPPIRDRVRFVLGQQE